LTVSLTALRKIDPAWRDSYNPMVLMGGATALYTLIPWWGASTTNDPMFEDFLKMQLVAFCGMAVGAVSASLLCPAVKIDRNFRALPRPRAAVIVAAQIIGLLLFLIAYNFFLGGLSNIVLFGYRNITEAEASTSIWENIMIVVIQYALPAVLVATYLTGVRRGLFYVCATIYMLLLLASGTRNFLVMFAGNFILISSVIRRRLSYPKLSVIAALLLLFLTAIGLYRNFGIDGRREMYDIYAAEGLKTLDVSSQELSTSFGVYRINYADPAWFPLAPGQSYLNAILAIVPTFVWPSRPDSISKMFSSYFAMPGEGLGFSNNLEAYINGGLVGVFLINGAFLYLFVVFYNRYIVERVTVFGLAFYGNMVFVAFNWNRIDFQTVFKISLIRISLFYLVASLLMRIVGIVGPRQSALPPKIRKRAIPAL